MLSFKEKVHQIVRAIPKGEILSYQEVARKAGSSRASRSVGNVLNKNHNPDIPCHRVIRSDGQLGGYNRGKELKRKILKEEGFAVKLLK